MTNEVAQSREELTTLLHEVDELCVQRFCPCLLTTGVIPPGTQRARGCLCTMYYGRTVSDGHRCGFVEAGGSGTADLVVTDLKTRESGYSRSRA